MHNILIKGGTVIDGTGAPGVRRDVAVDGSKIAGIYKESEGKAHVTINAEGMVVCPGFIDIHTHSDIHILNIPLAESRVRQGITTELVGNCGESAAPLVGRARGWLIDYAKNLLVKIDWTTVDEYLLRLANLRTSVNVATLVGAETLRYGVIGADDVKPTDAQMETMKQLLAVAMMQGAFGLSTGLIYAPGCYASTEEIIGLASTSAALGGFYASHIRGESRTVVDAVAEAIRIGREANTRVQISHHKACGRQNWGLVNTTLKMIEDARAEGVDVAFDVYPYTASSTFLEAILSPWMRDGGKDAILTRLNDAEARNRQKEEFKDRFTPWENTVAEDGWENIVVSGFKADGNKRFENKSLKEIASMLSKDPADATLDLLLEEKLGISAIFHEMSEDDVMRVMSHPLSCIGSDGVDEAPSGPTGSVATHPRSYGTFPRVLRRYALDKKIFTLEEAIKKMTAVPADRIGLSNRGVLAKGMMADIVVFDPNTVRDVATFEDSHRYAEGIRHVLVNGQVTILDGEHTKERAGQVIRHIPKRS
jgi:N-acyl-D-amino-acid deacylase